MLILLITGPPPTPPLFPYTTLFRSDHGREEGRRRQGLPAGRHEGFRELHRQDQAVTRRGVLYGAARAAPYSTPRSEEHTSELQSQFHLVCRLLLEKKKQ